MEDCLPANENGRTDELSLARIQKQFSCDKEFAVDVADLTAKYDFGMEVIVELLHCVKNVVDEALILQKVEEHRRNSGPGPVLQFPRAQQIPQPDGPAK